MKRCTFLFLLTLLMGAACGSDKIILGSDDFTAPALTITATPDPVEGSQGNTVTIEITYVPGLAGGFEKSVDFVYLTSNVPPTVLSIPTKLGPEDFIDNVARFELPFQSDILEDVAATIDAEGEDEIGRPIAAVTAQFAIDRASGSQVARFTPGTTSPLEDSVYMALSAADDPNDDEVLIDIWFKGSLGGTCVLGANFHILYHDDLASLGSLEFLDYTEGTLLNPDGNGLTYFADNADEKRIVLGVNRFAGQGCITTTAANPGVIITLRFKVLSVAPLHLNFAENSLKDIDGSAIDINWSAGYAWAEIQ